MATATGANRHEADAFASGEGNDGSFASGILSMLMTGGDKMRKET